jgi:hypothetical protein
VATAASRDGPAPNPGRRGASRSLVASGRRARLRRCYRCRNLRGKRQEWGFGRPGVSATGGHLRRRARTAADALAETLRGDGGIPIRRETARNTWGGIMAHAASLALGLARLLISRRERLGQRDCQFGYGRASALAFCRRSSYASASGASPKDNAMHVY